MSEKTPLLMTFDPRTIEHLGLQMYSTLPPVIAELVSNAYDAEATVVKISLDDKDSKLIVIEDNGTGMSFEEINEKFLKIGRNRRIDGQKSENEKRYVIGKKGLGKLSFFGVAEEVHITTVKHGQRVYFEMQWDAIKKSSGEGYRPEYTILDTDQPNGTKIELLKIKRKNLFDADGLATHLSQTFQVFNENDFKTTIHYNNERSIPVTNEMKYTNIESFREWEFPRDSSNEEYEYAQRIKGKIISSSKTVPSKMRGIALFSRGKLVSNYSFLDVKATSHGYSYITGWLDIDFIDDFSEDVISTNRQSLNWEREETSALKEYLEKKIKEFFNFQTDARKEEKKKSIEVQSGIQLERWLMELPKHERNLAIKITDIILKSEGIETEKAGELLKYTQDSFKYEAFKEMANEIGTVSEPEKLLSLFKEWAFIEAREMSKLAIGRIETIKKFKGLMDKNALEVTELHPFFAKFPWMLDSRINIFQHEVQYAQLLKEKFPEKELEEKNRRIDFLCTTAGNIRFIIELKRPGHAINKADIDQAVDYRSFLETSYSDSNRLNVVAYVIGGSISPERLASELLQTYSHAGKVFVKTYHDLLEEARKYHEEFITRYEELHHHQTENAIGDSEGDATLVKNDGDI